MSSQTLFWTSHEVIRPSRLNRRQQQQVPPLQERQREEKEKKGHKEASEKYKVVCEACNRYFQDTYTRSGHINAYHKEIIRQCGFCKSGFLYPWDYNKHLDKTHVWCDDCHRFVKDRASFNKHFREFHGVQQEKKDLPPQQETAGEN